jgi:hypothetical protein
MARKSIGTTKVNGLNGVVLVKSLLPRSAFILTRPSSAAQTQCRRLTLRQKATRVEASICMMTIDACQSISAPSQLLCLISIRLIDLDLSGNYVSPPSPHTAVRSVQPVLQDVDRINDKGRGLTQQFPTGGSIDIFTLPRGRNRNLKANHPNTSSLHYLFTFVILSLNATP